MRRGGEMLAAVRIAVRGLVAPPSSAAANSAAVENRSAGSFCSATAIASSTAGGIVFRNSASGVACVTVTDSDSTPTLRITFSAGGFAVPTTMEVSVVSNPASAKRTV